MDIFNLDENIKEYINEDNKADLAFIVQEFKNGHFTNVLSKTKAFREKHEISSGLNHILSLVDATSHAQTGDTKKAADIIKRMYEQTDETSLEDIILYGNLAFMCDFKLTRRIMSDAVKRIKKGNTLDKLQTSHVYLVLGEAEE